MTISARIVAPTDGRTAITEAIDLDGVDAVESLLDHCPELAWTKLKSQERKTAVHIPSHYISLPR